VVITADEDDRESGNKVLTVVLHAGIPAGRVVTANLTHYSLSRLYSQISDVTPLGDAVTSADMAGAFGLT
jgi:acid phosphatase